MDRLWNADVLASSNPDAHSDADDNVHANSVWFVRPCYGDIDADDDCDSDTKLESVRKPVCVHVGIAVSDGVYGNADSNDHPNHHGLPNAVVDRLWNSNVLAGSDSDTHSDADCHVHANTLWLVHPRYCDVDADAVCDSDTELESDFKPVCVHIAVAVTDGVYGDTDCYNHPNHHGLPDAVVDRLWNAHLLASSDPDAHSDADGNVHAYTLWLVRPRYCYCDSDAVCDCDPECHPQPERFAPDTDCHSNEHGHDYGDAQPGRQPQPEPHC